MSNNSTVGLFMISNPVFECYAFYGSILILKMIAMSFLTIFQRFRKKVRFIYIFLLDIDQSVYIQYLNWIILNRCKNKTYLKLYNLKIWFFFFINITINRKEGLILYIGANREGGLGVS